MTVPSIAAQYEKAVRASKPQITVTRQDSDSEFSLKSPLTIRNSNFSPSVGPSSPLLKKRENLLNPDPKLIKLQDMERDEVKSTVRDHKEQTAKEEPVKEVKSKPSHIVKLDEAIK